MRAWVLAAAWVALPSSAFAFECGRGNDGASLYWPTRDVPWVVEQEVLDAVGGLALSETQRSFDVWSNVACSDFTFTFEGIVASATAEFDGQNAVTFVADSWPYAQDAIAATLLNYDTRDNRLVDVDIELNGVSFDIQRVGLTCDPRQATMDLANTLTHEIGHMLGLDHPPNTEEFAQTTMFASAPRCETQKRSLEQDDIDGLCFIYPTNAPTQQCSPNAESSGCRHTDSGRGGLPAWLLLGGAWLLFRFARRRG